MIDWGSLGGGGGRAREFAIAAHDAAGCRYGAHPFVRHLDDVSAVLTEFGVHHPLLHTVAFLHDVLGDTRVTELELRAEFGYMVGDWVVAMTDEPGCSRSKRQTATYAKLRTFAKSYPDIMQVKLADRIANARASAGGTTPQHFSMYVSEHPAFCRELGQYGTAMMWKVLDKLIRSDPRKGIVKRVQAEWRLLQDVAPVVHRTIQDEAPRLVQAINALAS